VGSTLGQFRDIKIVWECVKGKLTTEEINKYLLGTDKTESTAWHWTAEWAQLRYYNKYEILLNRK